MPGETWNVFEGAGGVARYAVGMSTRNVASLAVLLALAVSACSGGGQSAPVVTATPAGSATATPSPSATSTSSGIKAAQRGLIDMGDITFHNTDGGVPSNDPQGDLGAFPGIFGGFVVNVTWAQLQSAQGGALTTAPVDSALAAVRQYNASNPAAPIGVTLRVWVGPGAPAWAKALDGGPISLTRNNQSQTITVPHWWMPDYVAAWQDFQRKLAAQYDGEPLILQVSTTSCSAQTDEPFVGSQDPSPLRAAGYTDALQESCLSNASLDYAPWVRTRVDFTFNQFEHTDPA